MSAASASPFAEVLLAGGPAPDRAEKMRLYGQFVGDWDTDILAHAPDGTKHEGRGEIHFAWVLQGCAIQDVWMIPRRAERTAASPIMPVTGNWYGTTLRMYDVRQDAWHIFWMDPGRQFIARQIGRVEGSEIVQEGQDDAGVRRRWRFTEIADTSFHWIGEVTPDGGATWQRQVDVLARRR